MALLVAGLLLFFAIHFLPSFQGARNALVARLGEKPYKLTYTIIAFVGLILIIIGKGQAEYIHLYTPPVWGRHITMLCVLVAFILLPASHMPTNIKRFTRHPMLWGVTVWGVGHLLANGNVASLLLFGGFAAYSLIAMISLNRRGATLQTHKVPLAKDAIVVAAGVVVYVALLFLHPYLFGVPVIP